MINMKNQTETAKLPDGEEAVPNEPSVASLMAMLIEIQRGNQEVSREQLKQTKNRNNAQPPLISVYNPQGEKDFPMPKLEREVLMPWSERPGIHTLTWEEVELMNMIRPGEYVVELLDGTPVQVCVLGTKNTITGKLERIAFMGERDPESNQYSTLFSKERRNAFPAIPAFLKQILDQQPEADYSGVLTMKERARRVALPVDHKDRLPVSVGE